MTESGQTAPEPKKRGGLAAMRVADLKDMATAIGIAGADSMRKPQLVEAIKGAGTPKQSGRPRAQDAGAATGVAPEARQDGGSSDSGGASDDARREPDQQGRHEEQQGQQKSGRGKKQPVQKQEQEKQKQEQQKQDRSEQKQDKQDDQKQADQTDQQGQDEAGGSRRSRRRRGRDNRDAPQRAQRRNEPDTQVLEDDVLVPAAGILDVLENYAFVRTTGYLAGSEDVYLSLSLVRKFGLRRGDAVTGQVRQPREGERREKFNPMVRIDSVNGADPETARTRAEFDDLTAVHPSERIRLETAATDVVGRVLDLVAPIGKGQRCLVSAPSRSGRTELLRSLARSVTTSCPEAHLMVVLLHERPEEITDFREEVAGEVVASAFDRPPADHVGVAELAVERAKRLVELGHDVVVLLDGLTRLARAHNHAGTGGGGGRTLPGGIDSGALLPSKRFFGAARAVSEGGSLTVVATAAVDTGSATDELVAEELEGTANAEVRLSRPLAAAGLHPAVDVAASGTRHEDRLLGTEEADAVRRLRGVLAARDGAESALRLLLERITATRSNDEMLSRVTK